MRIVAWILLVVGVALAGAGGARMGSGLAGVRAEEAPAQVLSGAQAGLALAFAEHSEALQAQRLAVETAANAEADPAQAAKAVEEADKRVVEAKDGIVAARDRIAQLREAGLWDGSFPMAVRQALRSIPDGPQPSERLTQWLTAGGPFWGFGVLFVVVGAFLERRAASAASRQPADSAAVADYPASVAAIVEALRGIAAEIAELPMDAPSAEPRAEIDRVQDELITPLVDARGQLIARHGTATFAVYFGSFSAGERNLARTWSALTDGHSEVARASLDRAIAAFEESLKEWERADAA